MPEQPQKVLQHRADGQSDVTNPPSITSDPTGLSFSDYGITSDRFWLSYQPEPQQKFVTIGYTV